MEKILSSISGKRIMLLGNNAIIRGALESGVQFVSTYPGTPASEIGNTFSRIAKKAGVYFEFSTNEKVALEAAAGASFCGLRALVGMKHFGLNVASDFLMPLVYSGVKGGMVVLVADDPNCWSSAQSEQNTRAFAYLAHVPVLEPSDPQECKDFTKFAFELSEKFKIPVMIRTTTRVAHQTAPVVMCPIKRSKRTGKFVKNPHQFVTMPPRVLEMKKELLEKIEEIRKVSEKSKINFVVSNQPCRGRVSVSSVGVVTSGISHLYAMEALRELNLSLPVLKLGFFYPLPQTKIKNFIKRFKKILVVEELEPYLEKEIEILARKVKPDLKIRGKDLLPQVGELKPEYVISAVSQTCKVRYQQFNFKKHLEEFEKLRPKKHIPRLCPGCPYHLVFAAIKKAVDPQKVIFGGEIGCYMLAGLPPHNIQDYLFCMGSSVGIAHGIKKSIHPPKFSSRKFGRARQKLITFVGDSSFFHAGIPALINTVYNRSNPLIIILDNRTTAMTGLQPHPGVGMTGMGQPVEEIKIEDVVRACGVKYVKTIDPVNIKEFEKTVKDFVQKEEVSVIIARRPCIRIR